MSAMSNAGGWRRWLILALASIGVFATVGLAVADPLDPGTDSLPDLLNDLIFVVSVLAFVLSGYVILSRRPDNRIGLLLLLPGVVLPVSELTARWLTAMGPPDELTPALWLLLWATGWSWVVLAFGIFHLLLVFPTGRLLTPRWRWAVALEIALIGTVVGLSAVTDPIGPMVNGEATWTVHNPVSLIRSDLMDTGFGLVWAVGLVTITVLSAVALVVRFRRGTPDEREQLKWPVAAAVLFGVVYLLNVVSTALVEIPSLIEALLGLGLAAIPVSVAIAILRYRLYEIDRIISRGLSWAALSITLLVVYGVTVVTLATVIGDAAGRDTIAVSAATLLAAVLFQPLRTRIQRAVDRRFHRARYDGERVVAGFGDRLRDEVDLDTLSAEIRRVAGETVRPDRAAVWLRSAAVPRTDARS